MNRIVIGLYLFFSGGFVHASQDPFPLDRSQQSFLKKDFLALAIEIKNALISSKNDPMIQDNLLSLLRHAYSLAGKEGVPMDWHLPAEVTRLKVSVRRIQKATTEFDLLLKGSMIKEKMIKQIKVTRYPDTPILNKEGGIGTWHEEPGDPGESPVFILKSEKSKTQIAPGLYFLEMITSNGNKTDGWFLLDKELNASEAPTILSPVSDEIIRAPQVTISWRDFSSPQYMPNESRSLAVEVAAVDSDKDSWVTRWEQDFSSPKLDKIRVPVNLKNQAHVLFLRYGERRKLGDLVIERMSGTVRSFRVSAD